jgi:uncharacterized protein
VPEPWQSILTLAAGFVTGLLSGMFGVGGAVVSTPAIRALGATPLQAVGSTLPSIFPSAVSGGMHYQREGLIDWRVARWTSLVGCSAAIGGSLLAGAVPGNGHVLMIATAALVGFTAYSMGRPSARPPSGAPAELPPDDPVGDLIEPTVDLAAHARVVTPEHAAHRDEWWRLSIIGLAAGGLSGLLGIGGGVLMVPAFATWVRMSIKGAIGTSLVCVGVLAVPGTITHALLGHIDWTFAIELSIAVIPGAQVGSRLAIRSSDRALRLTVAIVLGALAIVYATGEIVALARG